MPDVIQSRHGWFNGSDDHEPAQVSTEATEANEVLLRIDGSADWHEAKVRADVHLDALQAIQLGERLINAGRGAIARLELVSGLSTISPKTGELRKGER